MTEKVQCMCLLEIFELPKSAILCNGTSVTVKQNVRLFFLPLLVALCSESPVMTSYSGQAISYRCCNKVTQNLQE
jgi:hypothetical protein